MKKTFPYLFCVVFVLGSIGLYDFFKSPKQVKQGYFMTQGVFNDYKGTKELMVKLGKQQEQQKALLDSLAITVKVLESKGSSTKNEYNKALGNYQNLYQEFAKVNEQTMANYNDQLWVQINQYVNEYGKKEHYSMLFGANGSGSLMYADSSLNVSKEVLTYINQRYDGK